MSNAFGYYIKDKRIEKNLSIRTLASLAGISATYVSNLENGWRPAPSMEIVRSLADALELSGDEKYLFFDIAADSRSDMVAADIARYLKNNYVANDAVRALMELGISDADWQDVVIQMKEKYPAKND